MACHNNFIVFYSNENEEEYHSLFVLRLCCNAHSFCSCFAFSICS